MTRIAQAVARFKKNPELHLDYRLVHEACAVAGYDWRERVLGPLGPVVTVRLMLLQVLHGNVSCRAVGRLSGLCFSMTAYCKARARLPVAVGRSQPYGNEAWRRRQVELFGMQSVVRSPGRPKGGR